MMTGIWSGLIVGILFGIVLQRSFFCMVTGISNWTISGEKRLVRATLWTILFAMIGFHALQSMGYITLDPKPFFWGASIVGGILFGIGMMTTGSCMSGTPLRAGSGLMGFFLALFGMGVGGYLTIFGPLKKFTEHFQASTKITVAGKAPTFANIISVNPWVIVIIFSLIILAILLYIKKEKRDPSLKAPSIFEAIFKNQWTPIMIGIGLAAVEMLAYLTTKSPAGLGGFTKGYATMLQSAINLKWTTNWPVLEDLGIILGVFIAAIITNEFKLRWPNLKQTINFLIGGFLMGIGSVWAAGGCNIAHTITHVPQLSIGSFVSAFTIFLTAYIILYFKFKNYRT